MEGKDAKICEATYGIDINYIEEILDRFDKDWCYQKIPALDNKTPKESMKTEKGRELLKELLLSLENEEEHQKRDREKSVAGTKIIRDELKFYD